MSCSLSEELATKDDWRPDLRRVVALESNAKFVVPEPAISIC